MTSVTPEPIGKPSECLLLKNMFDPATEVRNLPGIWILFHLFYLVRFAVVLLVYSSLKVETMLQTDPEFDLDIRDDVQEERSNYGKVKHIYVDK